LLRRETVPGAGKEQIPSDPRRQVPVPQRYRFELLASCSGAVLFCIVATFQALVVLDIPCQPKLYALPLVLGSIIGLAAGRGFSVLRRTYGKQLFRVAEEPFQDIFDTVDAGIVIIDAENRTIVQANQNVLTLLGVPREELIGKPCRRQLCSALGEGCPVMDQGEPVTKAERLLVAADGTSIPVITTVAPVILDGRRHLVESFLDIRDRKRVEQEMQELTFHDSLTGLPNQTLLKDRLSQAIAQAGRDQRLVGVLFLDMDRFKGVNEILGHSRGDLLLKIVAKRLNRCVRRTDTVARLGGDEFVLVMTALNHADDVAVIAQKILDSLARPFDLDGQEIYSTASLGIALYPLDGTDVDALLRSADIALYQAKELSRNTYQFFSQEMNVKTVERLALETSLRRALERNELFLHFQPQIDVGSGLIIGMEALLRWQHPERGLVSPARFIPLAEETGLIIPIGEWVLRQACAQNRAWQESGFPPLRMAVNLSIKQFRQRNLLQTVAQALADTGLAPEFLELELTESCLMENPEETCTTLRELKRMGVQLAIDDFGTGYSSLSYLKMFPIDRLKIAQYFVRDIISDPDDAAIAEAIIALAHSLKLRVIAEGVETREQLEFLRQRRCDEMQGYYLGRPVATEEFTRILEREHSQRQGLPVPGEPPTVATLVTTSQRA
jgi:diguanylate cyclase (GGDEF)-like protein/PAS domain S-box-containing protein